MKAITTKYYGPTNTRGARISATDNDGNKATVSYDHSLSGIDCHFVAVVALCDKMNWKGVLHAGSIVGSGYVFVWSDDTAIYTVGGNK